MILDTLPVIVFGFLVGGGVYCEIEHNNVNSDGSFSFRHTNDDIGSYYHTASATPNNILRGRYGSRNPTNGQVEEVVYTAGPRGFRANGPQIHRKMNLAQYPGGPVGTPDDPLADPYDDPSYNFKFRTPEYSRTEDSDATGRISGIYSYLDDIGERHSVRYAAGAGTGFEVSNAFPDNPASVAYSAPLYKAHPKTRGKIAMQRGPDGRYKFIATGPDHRRAESSGPDGVVRGSYSYLDDKGMQRTVEYIAGAGIGYRIVHNSIGPGTHLNPSVSDFRLGDTDFKLANDFGNSGGGERSGGTEYLQAAGSGRLRPKDDDKDEYETGNEDDAGVSGKGRNDRTRGETGQQGGNKSRNQNNVERGKQRGSDSVTNQNSGSKNAGSIDVRRDFNGDDIFRGGNDQSKSTNQNNRDNGNTKRPSTNRNSIDDGASSKGASSSSNNYNFSDDDFSSIPPLITSNRKILEIDRDRDWIERNRDSTIIKNVGKWYIGLTPGQSVRAHVQNIDILPLGGRRIPSPSEALRQDELAHLASA